MTQVQQIHRAMSPKMSCWTDMARGARSTHLNAARPLPPSNTASGTSLAALQAWVDDVARLTQPDRIHWCDGSDAENRALLASMEADGTLIALNPDTHPNCWLHRSDPDDVARVEHLTFVCTREREDALCQLQVHGHRSGEVIAARVGAGAR